MVELKKSLRFSVSKAALIILIFFMAIPGMVFSQVAQKKIKTIIIDPGHGGSDPGARGEYEGTLGSLEKNVTLAISLKLVAELKKQMPGVNIIPTRTTDVYNSVIEKAKFANENHGDLFVSIHADAVALKTGSRIVGYRAETYHTTRYIGKGKKRKKVVTKHTREVPIKEYYKIPTTRKGTSTLILAAHKADDKVKAMENSDMQFELDNDDSALNINFNSPEWKASALLYSQNYFKKSFQLASAVQEEIAKSTAAMKKYFQSDAWKKQQAAITKNSLAMTKYFNSPEWKKQQQEIQKNTAKMQQYFKSDSWKKEQAEIQKSAAHIQEYFKSPEWKKQQQEIQKSTKHIQEYFNSPQWKKQQELIKKSADSMALYFKSDAWKKQQENMQKSFAETQKYFESAEWKKQQKEMKKMTQDQEEKKKEELKK